MMGIKVCLFEEMEVVRHGLALALEQHGGFTVCCQVSTRDEALERVADHRHDVLITDLFVQSAGGLSLIRELRQADPQLPVLVLSAKEEPLYAARSLGAGASGFLGRRSSVSLLCEAVKQVASGKRYLSESLRDYFSECANEHVANTDAGELILLSDRELEVFHHIGQGLKTVEIAEALNVSPKTVDTYRARIKGKLMLSSGRLLTRYAMEWVTQ